MKIADHSFDNVLSMKSGKPFQRSGLYRAKVVETNDPLNMNRIRVIIPDFYDADLDRSLCPWANPCTVVGGRGASYFIAPTIGDFVWIKFEKDDPHVPVYLGFANPTRRGHYAMTQVHTETVPVLNEDGKILKRKKPYDPVYLPKDGRPMKTGYVDTYGNMDYSSAVGYFPTEHNIKPAPSDLGSLDANSIVTRSSVPVVNDPDCKHMLRASKYGHIMLMNDQGYYWRKSASPGSSLGEFVGNQDTDYDFEAKRYLYLQKLINGGKPKSKDNRRFMFITRYGHVFDMIDVGWGQYGPVSSKTRSGEYGDPRYISTEEQKDKRFVRLRTKGGMYFLMGDVGAHPNDDKNIKKTLYDDLQDQEKELESSWGNKKDARFMMMLSRHGYKMLLDDRGSDNKDATKLSDPKGNGILLKGKRPPGVNGQPKIGRPSGFFFQMLEKDQMNSMMLGSPMGHVMEMNDKYEYFMLCSTMGRKWSTKWKGIKEHEFVRRPTMARDPEKTSHHLKIDHSNEYIRFKTRGGNGPAPANGIPTSVSKSEIQQGFEARDGYAEDGPWVELVDCQHRGMWMSKNEQLLILRGQKRRKMYMWMNEKSKEIVIYNGDNNGKLRIYSEGSIDIISDADINLQAKRHINIKGKQIHFETSDNKTTIAKNIFTTGHVNADRFNGFLPGAMPGRGAQNSQTSGAVSVEDLEKPEVPEKIEPSDRGKTYNGPFDGISNDELNPSIKE